MARMYSRKRGKSGSKKPMEKSAHWVPYKAPELEEIIVKLGKQGYQSAMIGMILRDQYGISSERLITKTKISKILKKHKLYPPLPENMMNLLKKAVNLHAHMDKNNKDYTSKRGLAITESKIRKFAKYYKRKGVMPLDWRYDLAQARLLVKAGK